MFGEFMVYVNDKPILLVCNNTVYLKKHTAIAELLGDSEVGTPYNGAKEHYILDVENQPLTGEVINTLEPLTSVPKPRKKPVK